MSEDVKIRLKFEQEGANAFAETKAKIEQLYKAAAAYEGKGMDTAAKSARSEAKSLEKDLARDAKERLASEKAIGRETKERASAETKAAKEQAAVDKARMSMMSRATRHVAGAVENAAGGSPLGALAGMMGGPAGIALQIGAAITAVVGSFARHADERRLAAIENTAERQRNQYHINRVMEEGTSSQAHSEEENAKEEMKALESKRAAIEERKDWHLFKPSSWFNHWGAGDDEDRENDQAIATKGKAEWEAHKATRKLFEEYGLKEIEIEEKRAKGHMVAAKAAEMALNYHKEVKRLEREGATPEEQIRGADAKFQAEMRKQEQAGASFVTARTSALQAARIASVGEHHFKQARESVLAQKMDEQKRLHLDTHNEAMAARTRPRFSSPPLHV